MSTAEVVDIVAGQVDAVEVATATLDAVSVVTGYVTATAGGAVSSPLVIDVTSVTVGAADVSTAGVGAVDVIMGPPGPPGPPGVPGPPGAGSGAAAAVHRNFAAASQTWEFAHGLGFQPFVMLYDSGGVVISGAIEVNTDQLTRVNWFYPIAGSMVLL